MTRSGAAESIPGAMDGCPTLGRFDYVVVNSKKKSRLFRF